MVVLTVSTHHSNGPVPGSAISLPPWPCMGGRAGNIVDSDQRPVSSTRFDFLSKERVCT